ncbi:hypothetical protein GCM10011588_63540 [Nocardia jinanensis]|uniref:Uncharacterized protein n=1 Tax=Nocardia jinanensis TaxID=382504 RepID=A0A917RX51_9NOCA|nr:hypothetical protein GCM10011588_63540 [Nocardia jinanensis]
MSQEKPAEQPATENAPEATLDLPYLNARVAIPGQGIRMKAGPIELSVPTRYLYYGGLGALTVAGAVEWPIAGALAATGLIIGRLRKPATSAEPAGAGTAGT